MATFKRSGKKEVPEVGTSSDIVFMFLFFFMVTTQMRQNEVKVHVSLPEASEVVKLERKDLASYINIGPPTKAYQQQYGTDARIQLNDVHIRTCKNALATRTFITRITVVRCLAVNCTRQDLRYRGLTRAVLTTEKISMR